LLRWTAREAPEAKGYWPATAVANHALAGDAVVDNATASTMYPLFDGTGWSEDRCTECGATAERMPRVEATGSAVGQLRDADTSWPPVRSTPCVSSLSPVPTETATSL
jgi:xylulokinase